jgi:thiol-disulfide isomerase/thioredoxin
MRPRARGELVADNRMRAGPLARVGGRMEVLGSADFDGPSLRRTGVWVVNFSADWCPFCVEFLPTFRALGSEPGLQLAVADLTGLDSPLWDRFHIAVAPTLIGFRDGVAVARQDGRLGEGLDAHDLARLLTDLRAKH